MKRVLSALAVVICVAVVVGVVIYSAAQGGGGAPTATTLPMAAAPETSGRLVEEQLYAAVGKDDLETAKTLLAANPKLAQAHSGRDGETPLHHAASVAMAKLLVEAGADVNAHDKHYDASAARWAITEWRRDVVAFLEQHGSNDDDLFYCAAAGKADKLAEMLTADPDLVEQRPPANDILGNTRSLVHLAANFGQARAAEVLLKAGADVNAEGGWSNAQPLENAAWAGFTDTVQVLVDHHADVNAPITNDQGTHNALWYAALTGRKEIVGILLKAGAKPDPGTIGAVQRTEQQPYFGRALPPREDYLAVIELLKQSGAKD